MCNPPIHLLSLASFYRLIYPISVITITIIIFPCHISSLIHILSCGRHIAKVLYFLKGDG